MGKVENTMSNVVVLGANGQIARIAVRKLIDEGKHRLTLVARNSQRLSDFQTAQVTIVEGDATDEAFLRNVLRGQDIVYANLAGDDVATQATALTHAMAADGVQRLVWISSIGIYDEVPGAFGKWNNSTLVDYLPPYKDAAAVVEGSGLQYTIVRPAWLYNDPSVSYELTHKGEPFKGTAVTRASIADLVVKMIDDPTQYIGESLGVDEPGTDGPKPSFMR